MKSKMKSMLASLAMFAVVFAVSAQPRHHRQERSPEERAKHMVEKMTEKLNLTEQQQQQIIDLHKEMVPQKGERPARHEMKEGERPSKEEMDARRAQMEKKRVEMRAQMEGKMKEILTPGQFETWKEEMNKSPREAKPEARRHDHKDGPKRDRGPREAKKVKECGADCNCKSQG